MRGVARAVTAGILVFAIMSAAGSEPATGTIGGLYCGTAWSGGRLVEVRTRLHQGEDGLLSGTYDFADRGGTTSGTLAENLKTSDSRRTLIWTDVYGAGPVVMTFDATGESFDGLWNSEPFDPAFQWDGKRCDATV